MHVVPNRIKIITVYKNIFRNHDFVYKNIIKFLINRKGAEQKPDPKLEPEPQFVISDPASDPDPTRLISSRPYPLFYC